MPIKIKSFQIEIDGVTYRADNLRVVSTDESPRRLIVQLTRYHDADGKPEISYEAIRARIDALKTVFARKFPDAPKFRESTRIFAEFREWVYWISGIQEEHELWAKAAKESGLIDGYLIDYDPQGGDK